MENENNTQLPEIVPEPVDVTYSNTDKPKKKNIFKSRGFKYGSVATAMTALVIVVVIAANLVLSILADRYSWSLDFTSTQMYEISDATKQVVNSLDKSLGITVTVFYEENSYPHYLAEPIKRFANLSDSITVKYIDPEKNPTALNQYGSEYSISQGAVVVSCGNRVRVFNVDDYLETDEDTGSTTIYLEEKLAAGVLFVTKEQIPVVYFLNGHGEEGYTALMTTIANNGADVSEMNLMTTDSSQFDVASKIMVICNPTRDYSDAEIRKLEDFLSNGNQLGRSLMYFSSTDAVSLPNLEKFLKTYGIAFNNDIVLDAEYCVGTTPYMVIPEFTTEEFMNTGSVLTAVTSPIAPNARSVSLLFAESDSYKTQKLITSFADTSYQRDNAIVSTTWDKQNTDKSGAATVAAVAMNYRYINNVQVQNYILACGSADMLEESILKYSGNGEYFMQIYKIMVDEQDDNILDARKSTSSTVATFTSAQTKGAFVVVIIAIPLLCLILGLIVYIKRRYK